VGFVDFHMRPPFFAPQAGERPVGSALARLQARDKGLVTNLKHQNVAVDALPRVLLEVCDGTRDRAALLDRVLAGAYNGELELWDPNGAQVADRDTIREAALANLEPCLTKLANHALLTG
jgi:methyltransferase-like protein